jgi:hypothetical protein
MGWQATQLNRTAGLDVVITCFETGIHSICKDQTKIIGR